jgi:hypothetical protein
MKTIIMRMQKFSRPGVILLATVVAIITSMVVANATQTITTPNAAFVSYSLAAGTNSAAITPVASRTVSVMGCCTNHPGAAQVSLLRLAGGSITWSGYESYSPLAFTGGWGSNTAGTHIVYIDNGHQVEIKTASADTILIHNGSSVTQTGNVTLIW